MLSKAVAADRFEVALKKQAYPVHTSGWRFNNRLLGGASSRHSSNVKHAACQFSNIS
jgi:hypothetical protein